MSESENVPRLRGGLILNIALAIGFAVLGALGAWFWQTQRIGADPAAGLSARDRAAVERVVQDYLMAHPEVLPRAMAELEKKQNAVQLASVRSDVERPVPGAVLGNPDGRITLVEFADYACGYCRRSVEDVDALIAANPDLKVVVRELPILSAGSTDAAKMAIAAAEQGKYAAFHKAMYVTGRPDAASIADAARVAGLDMARARKVVAEPATEAELVRNLDIAKQLGFSGTPSWIVGDTLLTGAVGRDRLAEAIAGAR